LKIRQLRLDKKMSLSEVAEKSNLSISYLNEIEKGKKYPKTEKIMALSGAFGVDYDDLVSLKVNKHLEPLSDLLNAKTLNQLPFDIFGISPNTFIELMSEAPSKVALFIKTITEISRNYDISLEKFYLAALRSYQESHDNYFEELEESAQTFRKLFEINNTTSPNDILLKEILQNFYQYHIEEYTAEQYPQLSQIRSIFDPNTNKLLINKALSSEQKAFAYGREIGYQYLQLKNRPLISSVIEVNSFEEVLNNFKASYFSGAVLINKNILIDRLTYLFASPKWDATMFLSIMRLFNVTPEVFMHRLSNLMPKYFNIKNLFLLHFDKNTTEKSFHLTKEMHLAKLHTPHGKASREHYCRRWLSLTLLEDFELEQKMKFKEKENLLCKAQISEYIDAQNNYLVICIAKASSPKKHINSSVTIGFTIDDTLKSMISFLNDSALLHKKVNETCERCGLTDCQERAKSPTILQQQQTKSIIKNFVAFNQ
jgi:XRE family transcriptional regulator, fatty acid utilization regulator